MPHALYQDLNQAQRREFQLWFLALGLSLLLGAAIILPYSVAPPGGDQAGPTSGFPVQRAVIGLSLLVSLFCLHTLHTLRLNGRTKNLLEHMGRLAATGMQEDDLLTPIADKICKTCSVAQCQLLLLEPESSTLCVKSAHADRCADPHPRAGDTLPLGNLHLCRQVLRSSRPVVLRRRDIERLSRYERELVTGGSKGIHSVVLLPMVTANEVLGIIVLGRARLLNERFTMTKIARTQALARHIATAIAQSRLKKEAIHDPLTNLYNRRYFSQKLGEEMARADRHEQVVVVLLCDLDGFKSINDTHGHQVGDEVLKTTAQCVRKSTRGTDLVFRWVGDEIAVILSNSSRQGSLIAAERIREGMRRSADTTRFDLDLSVGIAMYPEHGRSEDELMRTARRALQIAKKSKGKVHVGEDEYRLDRHAVKVVFQPVVDIASGRILGYEALARDPQGKLSPLELFEKYGAIGQLTELKQITLTSQIEAAQEIGLERVFINADFQVLGRLDPISKPSDLDVVVELSELEALHDLDGHLTVARSWREKGYKFALDDFGAGFVSFPFLSMLVPEYVKVDRSTMLQAVSSEKFKRFLKSLLGAVRDYAPEGIIAEGVEEEQELQIVKDMGISLVQGFLLGKPQELSRQPKQKLHPDRVHADPVTDWN